VGFKLIRYTRSFLQMADAYFDEPLPPAGVDVFMLYEWPAAVAGGLCTPFSTIIVDLAKDPEKLLAEMNSETRYEIRRASNKDGVIYQTFERPQPADISQFALHYEEFAASKGLPQMDRSVLQRAADAGALDLSTVGFSPSEPVIWHAYYRDRRRATLRYSASMYRSNAEKEYRARVGRANRYHHWRDMMRFRDAGDLVYDFGGWYAGTEDEDMLRINRFKEGFGGTVIKTYNCIVPKTWKGRFAFTVRSRVQWPLSRLHRRIAGLSA